MDNTALVSVITPVFNAEKFIEESVKSAHQLPEVGEIILIEDGSKDGSLQICQMLEKQFSKVTLLTHPNGENKGAGASRNLGLKTAKFPFLAFLDADDYFLPERFKHTFQVFNSEENEKVSGVYEPVGTVYADSESKKRFSAVKNLTEEELKDYVSFVKLPLEGVQFFESIISGRNGFPCTDGIVVRKSLVDLAGFFNESLRLHQDSEFWIRLAFYGYFKPTPDSSHVVAVRNVHQDNRIVNRSIQTQFKFYKSVLDWSRSEARLGKSHRQLIEKKYNEFKFFNRFGKNVFTKTWKKIFK